MKRTLPALTVAAFLALASTACRGNNGGPDEDPAMACTDLCTTSGFASGRAEVFPHEVNCFCEGGNASARVEAASCMETCTDLGWNQGEAFAVYACQCSN
jgi:hypothetical protein